MIKIGCGRVVLPVLVLVVGLELLGKTAAEHDEDRAPAAPVCNHTPESRAAFLLVKARHNDYAGRVCMKQLSRMLWLVAGSLLGWHFASAQPWSAPTTNAAPVSPVAPWSVTPGNVPRPAPQPAPQPVLSNLPLPPGLLAFDAEQKEYTTKPGEVDCPFTFVATNVSPAEIAITFIQTSCGCTTAKTQLPIKLAPGTTAEIPVNMNVAGKNGTVIKTVTVHTDKGQKVLLVKGNITPPQADPATMAMNRERNQQLAQADRQAVFKGECAKCHVEPVIGKMGRELYVAACGICHEAEHRASMVPDLHALKLTPNAEYWKLFITHGKPATLMPAFAQSQGGPLSELQINSLVEYLVKEFPHTKTNTVKHAHAH